MNGSNFEELIQILNIERGTSFERHSGQENMFQGKISLDKDTLTIQIVFPVSFPLSFPIIKIINPHRFYLHIGKDGVMCLFDDSSLLIKTDQPAQMLIDAFDRAVEILNIDSTDNDYQKEVAREFNAYWARYSKSIIRTNLSHLQTGDYKDTNLVGDRAIWIVSDTETESKSLLQNYFGVEEKRLLTRGCTIICLREFVVPPVRERYTWKWLRTFILEHVTGGQKRRFRQLLSKKLKTFSQILILAIPFEGREILIAFNLYCKNERYRPIEKMTNCEVDPISVTPMDYSYMTQRGGAEESLREKSVLLLGCGSLGGYIASNLCQLGICELDILDNDIFAEENVHRHILGFADAITHKNKADLMKAYLENQYPYVCIDSLNFTNRDVVFLLEDSSRLLGYDLIVSALGEPTLNLKINQLLLNEKNSPPFLCCFNEPYGIGGHVVAVNLNLGGCLRCMYSDPLSAELVPFRASLVSDGQNFKKSLSGCAGSFVEYSALDSQQTAILAVRLASELLSGNCTESTVLTWAGDATRLESNGFQTSEYYRSIKDKKNYITIGRRQIPCHSKCPDCRSGYDGIKNR